jgi:hypothetical protein
MIYNAQGISLRVTHLQPIGFWPNSNLKSSPGQSPRESYQDLGSLGVPQTFRCLDSDSLNSKELGSTTEINQSLDDDLILTADRSRQTPYSI